MAVKETGYVMLVGGPGVGKSTLAKVLDRINRGELIDRGMLDNIRQTNTLEFEYLTTSQELGGIDYSVTIQFLVPPGRTSKEGESAGRTFEDVIEIFKPTLHSLDVVLFTYDLTNRGSFQGLDFWIESLQDLVSNSTHFILLGTHLDREDELQISTQEIEERLSHLASEMRSMLPGWKGNFAHLEVSSQTGENLKSLIFYLAGSVVSAKKMQQSQQDTGE